MMALITSIVLGDICGGHDDSIGSNQPELTSGLVTFPLVLKEAVDVSSRLATIQLLEQYTVPAVLKWK